MDIINPYLHNSSQVIDKAKRTWYHVSIIKERSAPYEVPSALDAHADLANVPQELSPSCAERFPIVVDAVFSHCVAPKEEVRPTSSFSYALR